LAFTYKKLLKKGGKEVRTWVKSRHATSSLP
jgi:hypothetical protein